MNSIFILYPAIAMFTLTIGCILSLGLARYRGIHGGDVKISFYRTFDEGTQPGRLHLLARHVQNHFEVPPLFYVGVIFLYITNSVTFFALGLAWLYVASRCVHSFIHLGSNNVSQRFFTFGASLIFLAGMWLALLDSLIRSAA